MRRNWKIRIVIGLAIVAFAYFERCSNTQTNPYTGREQVIAMEPDQEIAIGLQATPQIKQQHGGDFPDQELQALVDEIGFKLVDNSIAKNTPYEYEFHLLADNETINAFALPGGQIFITYALLTQLSTQDEIAGVLGHEIGHVLGRHSAERIAETAFWQKVSQGASVGADAGGLIAGIGQNVLLGNSRDDELESDELGVLFMMNAGYNPEALVRVMEVLKAAAGPNRAPEFQSTHPDPDNRIAKIRAAIEKYKNN